MAEKLPEKGAESCPHKARARARADRAELDLAERQDQLVAADAVERAAFEIARDRYGFAKQQWVKTRPRNEALDTSIYAMAATLALGAERWEEWAWQEREKRLGAAPDPKKHTLTNDEGVGNTDTQPMGHATTAPTSQRPTAIKSKWMGG